MRVLIFALLSLVSVGTVKEQNQQLRQRLMKTNSALRQALRSLTAEQNEESEVSVGEVEGNSGIACTPSSNCPDGYLCRGGMCIFFAYGPDDLVRCTRSEDCRDYTLCLCVGGAFCDGSGQRGYCDYMGIEKAVGSDSNRDLEQKLAQLEEDGEGWGCDGEECGNDYQYGDDGDCEPECQSLEQKVAAQDRQEKAVASGDPWCDSCKTLHCLEVYECTEKAVGRACNSNDDCTTSYPYCYGNEICAVCASDNHCGDMEKCIWGWCVSRAMTHKERSVGRNDPGLSHRVGKNQMQRERESVGKNQMQRERERVGKNQMQRERERVGKNQMQRMRENHAERAVGGGPWTFLPDVTCDYDSDCPAGYYCNVDWDLRHGCSPNHEKRFDDDYDY